MEKMNELSQVITELRNCGNALMNIADSLQEIFSAPANEPAVGAAVQKAHNEKEAPAPANQRLLLLMCARFWQRGPELDIPQR